MTALHTLGILTISFTCNAFPTSLKEFPHMLSTRWLLFLHSAVQLIPNHLNWVEVRWLWRPGHLMQHQHSPSWSNSPYTACKGFIFPYLYKTFHYVNNHNTNALEWNFPIHKSNINYIFRNTITRLTSVKDHVRDFSDLII
jgi:hypothetical protein